MKSWIGLFLAPASLLAAEVKEVAVEHAGVKFRVVTLEARQVELVWKDAKGEPLATFDKVQARYAAEGKRVRFLMNAGIYEPGLVPSGLHHENGARLRPLNPNDGEGNFFLKPNGVFGRIDRDSGKAFIEESSLFAAREKKREPDDRSRLSFAIQGGPLLLAGGARHPKFTKGSPNKKLRNGVGVDADGMVVFALTAPGQEVNFWDFAGLFLQLGCRDALFLDGDISQMAVNPERPVPSNRFAAMFVVAE
jgi:uncharacterized protein YigE (DUF2233 family)